MGVADCSASRMVRRWLRREDPEDQAWREALARFDAVLARLDTRVSTLEQEDGRGSAQ